MVELLAPAGNKLAFLAAIKSGADAIYIGGEKFGARAYAGNFDHETLLWAIDFAHLYQKKVYLTINTLLKENELNELVAYLLPFYLEGLDGVIVQDFGVLLILQQAFPDLELHASTQMTVTGSLGANLLKSHGVVRVVPARELSLEEIKEIKNDTGLSIETFIHGAMCYGYSGQCLFSSMLGARSGNRGRCAGPCRLPYKAYFNEKRLNKDNALYQLSLKDLCSLDILPDLIDAGIDSFKIEGRMKSKEYVSFVTELYRYYMDAYASNPNQYKVSQKDKDNLQNMFSRGSIESGYYFVHNGKHLVTLQKPGYQSFDVDKDIQQQKLVLDEKAVIPAKLSLSGYFYAKCHEPMSLTLFAKDQTSITVSGEKVEPSQNRNATKDEIHKALSKMGNTAFSLDDLTIEMDHNIFLPNKQLNELRRNAVSNLTKVLLSKYQRMEKEVAVNTNSTNSVFENALYTQEAVSDATDKKQQALNKGFIIRMQTFEQFCSLKITKNISQVVISFDGFLTATKNLDKFKRKVLEYKKQGISVGLSFYAVTRKRAILQYMEYTDAIKAIAFDIFYMNNLETLAYIKQEFPKQKYPNITWISDHNFYIFQGASLPFFASEHIYTHTLGYELHEKEAKQLFLRAKQEGHRFSIPIYGHIPLMQSAGCVLKTNDCCEKNKEGSLYLVDRQNKRLPVIRHCDICENTIYNPIVLSLHKELTKLKQTGFEEFELSFVIENEKMMNQIVQWYEQILEQNETQPIINEFTKGHFAKGVE